MLMSITNLSGRVLNALEQGGSGVSPDAVGGNRKDPLPYPFDKVVLAIGASKTLPVRLADMRRQLTSFGKEVLPHEEWNRMVQSGLVSVTYAPETSSGDQEEQLVAADV
jgi:hypothetical protein